jgi:hypothetical protein
MVDRDSSVRMRMCSSTARDALMNGQFRRDNAAGQKVSRQTLGYGGSPERTVFPPTGTGSGGMEVSTSMEYEESGRCGPL